MGKHAILIGVSEYPFGQVLGAPHGTLR